MSDVPELCLKEQKINGVFRCGVCGKSNQCPQCGEVGVCVQHSFFSVFSTHVFTVATAQPVCGDCTARHAPYLAQLEAVELAIGESLEAADAPHNSELARIQLEYLELLSIEERQQPSVHCTVPGSADA